MKSLREALEEAERTKAALAHFNVSDLVILKAVVESARELDAPVLVGVSEGEREFLGVRQVAALVRSFREEYGTPIFLNADHTHSLARRWRLQKPASTKWYSIDPRCRTKRIFAKLSKPSRP